MPNDPALRAMARPLDGGSGLEASKTAAENLRQPCALVHDQRQHTAVSIMGDKPAVPRHRVVKAEKIEISGGAIDCTVRNLSINGAALHVESPVGIPDKLVLVIPSDQLRRACWVMWLRWGGLGSGSISAPTSSLLAYDCCPPF